MAREATNSRKSAEFGIRNWLRGSTDSFEAPHRAELNKLRIAVLPFTSLSSDPEDEFFADGITEELISTLSKIDGLQVIARASIVQYKEKKVTIGAISKDLMVGTILEGSVRRAQERIRINARLIDAQSGDQLWTENYDRELKNVFAIQSEIAARVAASLKLKLLPSEKRKIGEPLSQNSEAHTLYLRGRHEFQKFTKEGFDKGEQFYQNALALDPNFATAYEGLASVYLELAFFAMVPEKEAYPKAREFAERALELDDTLSDSHYVLARVLIEYYCAIATGEVELRKCIRLNPNHAMAHLHYAWLLSSRLDLHGTEREVEAGVARDPKSAEAWWRASFAFQLGVREYDRAIELALKSTELNPFDPTPHLLAAFSCAFSGRQEEAIRHAREAVSLSNNDLFYRANLAQVYGWLGRKDETKKFLDELVEISKKQPVPAMHFVVVYCGLGDLDNFFIWLEKSAEERAGLFVYSLHDPGYDLIGALADPRFHALMKKYGIE